MCTDGALVTCHFQGRPVEEVVRGVPLTQTSVLRGKPRIELVKKSKNGCFSLSLTLAGAPRVLTLTVWKLFSRRSRSLTHQVTCPAMCGPRACVLLSSKHWIPVLPDQRE